MDLQQSWLNSGLHIAVLENDEREFSEYLDHDSVKYMNLKCEIPLHLAAKKKDVKNKILTGLINTGSDINYKNKWGQTPLHYAAFAKSLTNMKTLLKVTGVDVKHKDVNGYNALHFFIYQDCKSRRSDDYSCDTTDIENGMRWLLDSGINIDDQTKFGYNILHIAAERSDNYLVLLYILQNFPTPYITQLNKFGENFLHIYARSDIFENIIDLLETIAAKSLPVHELLSQKNAHGKTPWSFMVDGTNMSEDCFNSILGFGISTSVQNNFGNNVLHTNLNKEYFDFILHHILRTKQGINDRNIFGQSCLFTLYMEPVLDTLLQSNSDFHTTDRWGRTPFMSIMTLRPRPIVLEKLIENGRADVNSRDCHESTPLHIAAYFNYEEQVKLLIKHGADVNCVDSIGDKPIDTVKRHCGFRCISFLRKVDTDPSEYEVLYARNKPIHDILVEIPKTILSSSIESKDPQDIREILGLPQNIREFTKGILEDMYFRKPIHASEFDEITNNVNSLIRTICKRIGNYDHRFQMKMYPTGSSAEGTKVGPPDEFDFVLCLTQLEELCDIKIPRACFDKGYACLLFKDFPHTSEDYLPFSDFSGYFLAFPYLQFLARYVQQALNETKLWESGNFYFNAERPLDVIAGKPVFNFEVYWIGSLFKHLKISIDLVPVVYKKGWWPQNISLKDKPLVNEHVASAGCFLMLQTYSNRFDKEFKWESTNDAIFETCNHSSDSWENKMLRVSSAPAEIRLMQSLPGQFRHAYALAKILVSEVISPDIEIDKISTKLYTLQTQFEREKPAPFKPGRFIKSYMLKNCVFYILQELSLDQMESDDVLHTTLLLFNQLLKFSDDYNFVPYFLPLSDVFQFEKEEQRSSYKDYILKLKRQLSIKLVLGILNHQHD